MLPLRLALMGLAHPSSRPPHVGMDLSNTLVHTVYREHPANYSDLANTNTGDEVRSSSLIFGGRRS